MPQELAHGLFWCKIEDPLHSLEDDLDSLKKKVNIWKEANENFFSNF